MGRGEREKTQTLQHRAPRLTSPIPLVRSPRHSPRQSERVHKGWRNDCAIKFYSKGKGRVRFWLQKTVYIQIKKIPLPPRMLCLLPPHTPPIYINIYISLFIYIYIGRGVGRGDGEHPGRERIFFNLYIHSFLQPKTYPSLPFAAKLYCAIISPTLVRPLTLRTPFITF
jgi:hypothetical protein